MSNIVIVSGLQIFPPVSGGHIRSSTLARALSKLGHNVYVYSYTGRRQDYLNKKRSHENTITSKLVEYINLNPVFGVFQHLSYRFGFPPFWLTAMTKIMLPAQLRKKLIWCDVAIIDFPFLYPVLDKIEKTKILNTHNVEANLYASTLLSKIVKKYECSAITRADISVFCSEADELYFKNEMEAFNSYIVPNGIEKEQYARDDNVREQMRKNLGLNGKHVSLFTGSSYRLNKEAFLLLIDWAEDNKQELLHNNIVILVVGSVSNEIVEKEYLKVVGRVDSIIPYFSAADSAINPVLGGSGTNIKMMEYLAAKLPILTTMYGARGLMLEDKIHCLYFDLDSLIDRLLELCSLSDIALKTMIDEAYQKNLFRIDMSKALARLAVNL